MKNNPVHAGGDERAVCLAQEERRVLSWLIESILSWWEVPLYVHEGETLGRVLERYVLNVRNMKKNISDIVNLSAVVSSWQKQEKMGHQGTKTPRKERLVKNFLFVVNLSVFVSWWLKTEVGK